MFLGDSIFSSTCQIIARLEAQAEKIRSSPMVKCRRYLFSTSGKIFGHPHDRTIELILDRHQDSGKPQLYFNYRTGRTERWADTADQAARRYEAYFPTGMSVEIG